MGLLRNLCFAFTASSGFAMAEGAEGHTHIKPEDCTDLIKAGEASFYGEEVAIGHDKNGNLLYNPVANGEVFNPQAMTAAFRDKAYLNSYVMVVRGEERVIVKINDYGPFSKAKDGSYRAIDLTEGAAAKIDLDMQSGVAQVKIYACNPPVPAKVASIN